MTELAVLLVAYLIGSFPTGYVLTRVIVGQDLRGVGSGGTGATNARRALGSKWGASVALIDVFKGAVAVVIARATDVDVTLIARAALVVVAAHCWPVWLGFRGGKGVATGFGAAVALTWWGLLLAPILVVVVALTRYVSAGSLAAALSAPLIFGTLAALDRVPESHLLFAIGGAALIVWRHRENIARLRAGTERRLVRQAPTSAEAET